MPLIRSQPVPAEAEAPSQANPATELVGGNVEQRWSAARRLAQEAGSEQALGAALSKESETKVRDAIFTSLAHLNSEGAVEALLPCLRSPEPAIRTGAIDALGAMGVTIAPFVERLLADSDPDIRLLSCELARRLPSDKATELLCDLLEREAGANVSAAAIEVLAEVGNAQAVSPLLACRERFAGEPFITFAVNVALERVGQPHSGDLAKSS